MINVMAFLLNNVLSAVMAVFLRTVHIMKTVNNLS